MRTFRKLTALAVAVMLVFSMCFTAISAAAAETDTASVLYLKPNTNWTQSNARFALYVFNGSGNAWASMTAADDGYYQVTVPAGDWTGYIFCRMNPSNTTNSWSYKWNQTSDLTLASGVNCYTVKDATWDKGGGEWSLYTPATTEPSSSATADTAATTVAPTTTVKYDYTVAGDVGLTGIAWDPSVNGMTDSDSDGVYDITFSNIAAGSYSFKVTDGTWANSWGAADGGNYSITLTSACDVKISFDSTTKAISVKADGMGDFVLNYMAVVGNGTTGSAWMNGEVWNTDTEANKMTDMGNGLWSITFNNVAASTAYQCKFIANNSYTYNWTSDGNFDGQIIPSIGVPTDGSTVTLTIDVSGYDFANKTGSVTTNVAVNAPVDPSESTSATEASTAATTEATESTEAPAKDYYIFGYINGANYGCEEDYQNLGDYKFVDGNLVATFDADSYVGVKTSDNANWYMTDGWAGSVTSTTLYNSTTLGTTANKLLVPGGVEVTFTLVVNADDTLTLSYVAAAQPTTEATEATTEAPTTVEPTTVAPTTVAPTTVAPTTEASTVPTDGYYVIGSSFKVKLNTCGTNKVNGSIALQAGTYTIKLDNYGTMLGYGKTVNDYTTGGLTFKSTYSSSVTLNATGGVYTFQVNTSTNTLIIKYDNNLPNEYLIGDLNTVLTPVSGKTLAIGTSYLAAGKYQFKMSIGNVAYGYGKVVQDSTPGALSFSNKYSSYCTLNATGGTYTFTLNTATNKLTIGYIASKDEAVDDVHVTGDISLVLDDNGGESNVATGSTTLAEGTYSFKIYNYGTAYTIGEKIVDHGSKTLKSSFTSYVTLVATGGTYTFSFDKTTNKITVTNN